MAVVEMGCITGKELVARGAGADEGVGKDGQVQQNNPNNIAAGQKSLASTTVTELYWVAGSIDSPNVAPHFTPPLGPQTLFEKLPPPPQNVRRRVLFASQEDSVPLAHMFLSGDGASMISDASTTRKPLLTVSVGGGTAPQPSGLVPGDVGGGLFASSASRRRSLDFLTQLYSGIPRLLHQEAKYFHTDVLHDALKGRFTLNDLGAPILVPVPQPGTFRSQFYLPDEALVARAFFPQSMCNISVGWVKLPAGPVVVRSTRDASSASPAPHGDGVQTPDRQQQQFVIRQIDGLENTPPTGDVGNSVSEVPEEAPRGYLCATKPSYDVAVDGPVSSPFVPPCAPPLSIPRYLEKYFLYVKRVVSIGITLGWKDATDAGAEFEPVVGGGAFFVADDGSAASSKHSTAAATVPGGFFTFVAPSPIDIANGQSDTGAGGIFSLFNDFFAWSENSFPILFTSTNHQQYNFWKRVIQLSSLSRAAAATREEQHGRSGSSSSCNMAEDERAMIAASVKELSMDEKLWLAFQLRFKKFIVEKCRQLHRQHQPNGNNNKGAAGGGGAGPEDARSVQLGIKVGLRMTYDNQHFVAYNAFGKNNIVSSSTANISCNGNNAVSAFSPLSPRSADSDFLASTSRVRNSVNSEEHFSSFLQFTDTSRKPETECSKILSESVCVLTCRTSAAGALSGAGNAATESESSVGPRSRTIGSVFEPEIAALELLFSQFIPDVKIFEAV